MSQETVAQFLEVVKANPELQAKLKESNTIDNIISQASIAGYDITASDLEAYGKAQAANGELSEGQLENVAGGFGGTLACFDYKVFWSLVCNTVV